MWQETKHGLYKQFNFDNFHDAFAFMTKVAALAEQYNHHPRWENEWSVVQIWLITHDADHTITDKDREMAQAIDDILKGEAIPSDVTEVLEKQEKVKLFADGGSRGNPGPSASGFAVLDMNDKVLLEQGVYLGVTTNNMAEYTALKLGLEAARKMGVHEVEVYMDSMLVVNQMKGIFKIKNRDLWAVHDAIKQMLPAFRKVTFDHVPREFNKIADAMVNHAMDVELGIKPSSHPDHD